MINLSFDELRLVAQIRNTSDYENKSKECLIKALGQQEPESKRETKSKSETKPEPELKTETREAEIFMGSDT